MSEIIVIGNSTVGNEHISHRVLIFVITPFFRSEAGYLFASDRPIIASLFVRDAKINGNLLNAR